MKRRLIVISVLATLTAVAATTYDRLGAAQPTVTTEVVSRGSIVTVISATGTLEAVETVEVGTQVSGTVQSIGADFNSIVKKGQVLARLDPALIQADVQRNRANVAAADADIERQRVLLGDAETKLTRAQELSSRQLIPTSDLDAAVIARRSADAQVKSAVAQATQARATLRQSEINLQKTVITAPIDGIVISRAVDVGQTVAASLQAPTLFTLAADLEQMQLNANIDESDLGSIREGQAVSFRVDAYPNQTFTGGVKQVRLNPSVVQNVVTYSAIITARNPDLKLKPGMTASLSVEVSPRRRASRPIVGAPVQAERCSAGGARQEGRHHRRRRSAAGTVVGNRVDLCQWAAVAGPRHCRPERHAVHRDSVGGPARRREYCNAGDRSRIGDDVEPSAAVDQ